MRIQMIYIFRLFTSVQNVSVVLAHVRPDRAGHADTGHELSVQICWRHLR